MYTEGNPTQEEIIIAANQLAREFYSIMGYVVPDGKRFDKSTHPQERTCWEMACYAFDFIEGTDVKNTLQEWEDEQAEEQGDK